MAAIDQLNALMSLGQVLGGKSTTTKGSQTSTQQTNISDTGAQELLRQILAGPGGLANISGQARGSGLYDSTTEAVLKGNAAARAAADVEARRSPTTQTTNTTQTQSTPGLNLSTLAGPLALGLGRNLLGAGADYIGGLLNPGTTLPANLAVSPGLTLGGAGAAGNSLASSAALASGGGTANLASMLGGAAPAASSTASLGGALAGTGGALSTGLAGAGAGAGAAASAGSSAISAAPGLTLGGSGAALGGATAMEGFGNLAMNNVPVVGSVLSGLLSGGGVANTSLEQFLGAVGSGAMAMGPMGMIAAPVAMTFGAMLNDLGISSIVCTALVKKGLLDQGEYAKGQAYIQGISRLTIRGYHLWGKPMAAKIDAEVMLGPWTKRALPWAKSRTKLIAATGWTKYFKYPRGTLTLLVGQPLCWMIGWVDEMLEDFGNTLGV